MTNLSRRTLITATAVAGATVALPLRLPLARAATRGNPRPAVIPALQEWQGGDGAYRLGGGARVVVSGRDAEELLSLARQLTRDIADVTGVEIASPRTTRRSRAAHGEILLRLDPAARHAKGGELYAREGY